MMSAGTPTHILREGRQFEVDAVTTVTDALDYTSLTPDYRLLHYTAPEETSNQTTTSTSYTKVINLRSAMVLDNIPTNATLYGRFIVLLSNNTGGETTTARPRIFDDGAGSYQNLTALEVSATGTDNEVADSGWQDISGDISNLSNEHRSVEIEMKVSAGTGEILHRGIGLYLAGAE